MMTAEEKREIKFRAWKKNKKSTTHGNCFRMNYKCIKHKTNMHAWEVCPDCISENPELVK